MSLLAAIFVAGVGLYTIYCGPRSWPHGLAGCAGLGFAVVDQLFPADGYSPGFGFTFVAALCISAGSYLVSGTSQNLRWVALALALGSFPLLVPNMSNLTQHKFYYVSYIFVGLLLLVFLIAPGRYWRLKNYIGILVIVFYFGVVAGSLAFYAALYFMPVWGGALLIFRASKYIGKIENAFRRVGIIFMAAGFILVFNEYWRNISIAPHTGLEYMNRNPALRELNEWLAPLLVAIGIVATCFAVVRLIPRQPDAQPETIEPSDQVNPL